MKERQIFKLAEDRVHNMLEHYAGACENSEVIEYGEEGRTRLVKWEEEYNVIKQKEYNDNDLVEFFRDEFSIANSWWDHIKEWDKVDDEYHIVVEEKDPPLRRIFQSIKGWHDKRFLDYRGRYKINKFGLQLSLFCIVVFSSFTGLLSYISGHSSGESHALEKMHEIHEDEKSTFCEHVTLSIEDKEYCMEEYEVHVSDITYPDGAVEIH